MTLVVPSLVRVSEVSVDAGHTRHHHRVGDLDSLGRRRRSLQTTERSRIIDEKSSDKKREGETHRRVHDRHEIVVPGQSRSSRVRPP